MSTEIKVEFLGQAGKIEGRYFAGEHQDIGVLMCHPHPLFQGTMSNKVVTTITRAAQELGLSTLRFNFRGVGGSEGEHDNGIGEQEDVLSAMRYAKQQGWGKVILAGFSFGSGMACLAAQYSSEEIAGLFLLAPPVHHFDAPNQLPFEFETFIYYGDADEVVPVDEMQDWAERVIPTPHIEVFMGAGHFFHGRLVELRKVFQKDLHSLSLL